MSDQQIDTALILGTVGKESDKLFEQFPGMSLSEEQGPVKTPYGEVFYYVAHGCNMVFYIMERHECTGISMYPHELWISSPAELYFLIEIKKVKNIIPFGAVGAANGNNFEDGELKPGDIIVPNDFMDLSGQVSTFAVGDRVQVKKLAVAHQPAGGLTICHHLRALLANQNIELDRGVLNCTLGPRFETTAEKKALFSLGADLFGMHTTQREWILCQEVKDVHFLPLLHVTNMVFENPGDTGHDVDTQAKENFGTLMEIFFYLMRNIKQEEFSCNCHKREHIFDSLDISFS